MYFIYVLNIYINIINIYIRSITIFDTKIDLSYYAYKSESIYIYICKQPYLHAPG